MNNTNFNPLKSLAPTARQKAALIVAAFLIVVVPMLTNAALATMLIRGVGQ